jgi:hypothetical protein
MTRLRQGKVNYESKSYRDDGYQGRIHCVGIEPLAYQNEKRDQRNQDSDDGDENEQIADNGDEQGVSKRANQPHYFGGKPNDEALNNHADGKAYECSDKVHAST